MIGGCDKAAVKQHIYPTMAIIAIARLENDYIKEWVEYHLKLGVSHIYIYDNAFNDEPKIEYRNDGVTIIPAYNKILFQNEAYTESYNQLSDMYDYLCFIDIDEFIQLNKNRTIGGFLNRIPKDIECLRINWQCFSDGDMIERDMSVNVHEAFTKKIKIHGNQTKSIVKGGLHNIEFTSPHHPIYEDVAGHRCQLLTCDGHFNSVMHFISVRTIGANDACIWVPFVCYDYIQLNHYRTKTLKEYMINKLSRDDATRTNYVRKISKEFFTYNKRTPDKIKYYNEHKEEYVKNPDSLEDL